MSTIYHASGTFHYPSSQALEQAITALLKTPVLKQSDGIGCESGAQPALLVFQYDDPEVHLENPANFEQNTFTLPYGEYQDAPSLIQLLSAGATRWQAEYLSDETPVVAFLTEKTSHTITGLSEFELLAGPLSDDEKIAFIPDQWEAAGIEHDDPDLYDDERRFQLTDGVMQRVLRALLEKHAQ